MKCIRAVLFIAVVLLVSCHKDDGEDVPQTAERTVFVYLAGHNSLGVDGSIYGDSLEIADGAISLDKSGKNRLVVLIDRVGPPNLYEVLPGKGFCLLKHYPHAMNTADGGDFRTILNDVAALVPSKEYSLVMGSHATGWLPPVKNATLSFGIDVGEGGSMGGNTKADGTYGDEMDIPSIAWAIETGAMKHVRYIFFDACLMQSLETAYELRHVTDYVVASPIAVAAEGANYTRQINKGLFNDDVTQIAKTYVEDYMYEFWGTVFSVIKTDALEDLANFTRDVMPASFWDNSDMKGVLDYGYYNKVTFYRPHCYDAAAAMRQLLGDETLYAQWREKLDKAVVYRGFTTKFYVEDETFYGGHYVTPDPELNCGVSMFVPLTVYTVNAGKATCYGDHNDNYKKTAWSQAITHNP